MSTEAQSSYVPWPPPGLEPLHGKLEPIVTLLGLADLLLVLPLLAVVGTAGHFWSTGPFGGALVHSPGEEALFALSSRGILGTSGCLPGWKVLGLIRENY